MINKVVVQGAGQDTTYKNYIADLYPDLKMISGAVNGYGYQMNKLPAENVLMYYRSKWLSENIKLNHGKLMEAYHLIGDGAYYYGEPDLYQFGQRTTFGFGADNQVQREKYDWLGEGDSIT